MLKRFRNISYKWKHESLCSNSINRVFLIKKRITRLQPWEAMHTQARRELEGPPGLIMILVKYSPFCPHMKEALRLPMNSSRNWSLRLSNYFLGDLTLLGVTQYLVLLEPWRPFSYPNRIYVPCFMILTHYKIWADHIIWLSWEKLALICTNEFSFKEDQTAWIWYHT